MRLAGHEVRIREFKKDFGEKARKKRPQGRPRHRWEDNIEKVLR
jgi:hypothetical protein